MKITGQTVLLPVDDVDTDQIIPARFLKVTDKSSLGQNLFADWPNKPQGGSILVAGKNFGCGSSREHAPWALLGGGFKAVISSSFADIFKGNALKNGLLPVEVDAATHALLLSAKQTVTIDLQEQSLTLEGGAKVTFPIDSFARHCLLNGLDELSYLLGKLPEVEAYEARRL